MKEKNKTVEKEIRKPVLRVKEDGTQVAGFRNTETGEFEEIMLISTSTDLDEFMEKYDIATITKE